MVPDSRSKVSQQYTNSHTCDLLVTYFQGPPPKPTFGPTFDLLEFSGIVGASRRTRAT